MTDEASQFTPERVGSRLGRLIAESTRLANELASMLAAELQALEHQDADELAAAARRKAAIVEAMDALEGERRSLAAAAGVGADDMAELLAWCKDDSTLADAWQTLLTIAARCEQDNRRNGAISHVRQQQIRGAFALLSGTAGNTPVYSRAGKESTNLDRREIARA